jgi:hypothetical protein
MSTSKSGRSEGVCLGGDALSLAWVILLSIDPLLACKRLTICISNRKRRFVQHRALPRRTFDPGPLVTQKKQRTQTPYHADKARSIGVPELSRLPTASCHRRSVSVETQGGPARRPRQVTLLARRQSPTLPRQFDPPQIAACRLLVVYPNYEQWQFGENRFAWQNLISNWWGQAK